MTQSLASATSTPHRPGSRERSKRRASTNTADRTVLFLDIDDVVCLNNPYGGYDVALALSPKSRGQSSAPPGLWDELFDASAREHLKRIDEEFRPLYVISSSWSRVLDDVKLRQALSRGGLQFVVDSLHRNLVTPTIKGRTHRFAEISAWLKAHPEFANRYVVLDDELSGTGFDIGQPSEHLPFIVMCRENVGLTEVEYVKLRVAFQLRRKAGEAPPQ